MSDDRSSKLPARSKGVGYCNPPAEHRFQKGRSGNPAGRPKGRRSNAQKSSGLGFGEQPTAKMLLAEAYRTVVVREGEKVLELPAIQAVFRAMGVSAMKGNRFAQRTLAELVQKVEEEDRQLRLDYLQASIEYKVDWEKAIEHARKHGLPEPEPLPHPDDVIIDLGTGEVRWAGPRTKEEKQAWDQMLARRDEAQSEVTYHALAHRRARDAKKKEFYLQEWHFEQRMFDIINDRLPDRYQKKLENRSWHQDATRPGTFVNRRKK